MKTTTLFKAYDLATKMWLMTEATTKAQREHRWKLGSQSDKFRAALLARIEAGDQAREALDELANNWYSLDSDEGKSIVEDMEP